MKKIFLILAALSTSCGLVSGGSSDSRTGNFSLGAESGLVNFETTAGTEIYRSISVTNNDSDTVTVTSIVFAGNSCNAFSLYSVTDTAGNILFNGTANINLPVAGSQTIRLVVRYNPSSCIYTDYDTTLYVYYSAGGETRRASVTLKPTVTGTPPRDNDETRCEEENPDDFEYTPITVTGRPSAGEYYLEVRRLRAFIYTGILNPVVGTDIDENNFPAGTRFEPPHLKITVDGNGSFVLDPITLCENFYVPSATSDSNFFGRPALITSVPGQTLSGNITENGQVTLSGLRAILRVENLSATDSIVKDPNSGTFQVTLQANLTTLQTEENIRMGNVRTVQESLNYPGKEEDEDVIPLSDSDGNGNFLLTGTNLQQNGDMTMVSIATFLGDNFIGSEPARIALLTNAETAMFLQLDATFTTRAEATASP